MVCAQCLGFQGNKPCAGIYYIVHLFIFNGLKIYEFQMCFSFEPAAFIFI
jgi:hypothetical protein